MSDELSQELAPLLWKVREPVAGQYVVEVVGSGHWLTYYLSGYDGRIMALKLCNTHNEAITKAHRSLEA